MKIAIYSPYLDTVGGGEKYILTIAEILSDIAQVDVLLDAHLSEIGKDLIIDKLTTLHGINFSKINFKDAPVGKGGNFLKRMLFLTQYDWMFYLTDGSIFFSTAKNSILHFQVPFTESPKSLWGNIKLSTWQKAIYNSNFTKSYVEKNWNIKGEVIYPPVDTKGLKILKKKKQILSVGRFFGYLRGKKQDVLINAFKELKEKEGLSGWSLHLVGAASAGDQKYVEELKLLAQDEPVYFHINIPRNKIVELYGESQIYWHAMGYGETDPKKFEHFGIAVVEAMAAGCVPVIINLGGLKEIVEDGVSGIFWNDIEKLKKDTVSLINNSDKLKKMSGSAREKAMMFSQEIFKDKIKSLINEK